MLMVKKGNILSTCLRQFIEDGLAIFHWSMLLQRSRAFISGNFIDRWYANQNSVTLCADHTSGHIPVKITYDVISSSVTWNWCAVGSMDKKSGICNSFGIGFENVRQNTFEIVQKQIMDLSNQLNQNYGTFSNHHLLRVWVYGRGARAHANTSNKWRTEDWKASASALASVSATVIIGRTYENRLFYLSHGHNNSNNRNRTNRSFK